jgi:hypothetical protein
MNRISVSSSNVSSVGFENGVLEVEFHGGRIYRYFGVPENVFNNLLRASSKGTFLNNFIKNRYRFIKVR